MKITTVMFSALFFLSMTVQADTYHHYFNGRVTNVSVSSIQIGKRKFAISSGSRVVVQVTKHGGYYEETGRISMINRGDSVTVRAEGSAVNEIILERWKR